MAWSFQGLNQVLGGMRLVHSIREDDAFRIEGTPSIVEADLEGRTPSLTMSTHQQHWWTDPITGQQVMANRTTVFRTVRVGREWHISEITVRTVIGPLAVDFAPFASPYGR